MLEVNRTIELNYYILMAFAVSNCDNKLCSPFPQQQTLRQTCNPNQASVGSEVWQCVIKISVLQSVCHFPTLEVEVRALSQKTLEHLSVRARQKEGGRLREAISSSIASSLTSKHRYF